jgi:cobyrinic acid a,c-diamide synthase
MERHLDLEGLLSGLPEKTVSIRKEEDVPSRAVRIGVARDEAFCFYYPENLEWLSHFGAEIVTFSPLKDRTLPSQLDGIYLGGGYPEVFSERLAENDSMRDEIHQAARAGLPIYAECGGLMYLSEEIRDLEDRHHPMTGILPLKVRMLPRLKSLGYREITLTKDCLLGSPGMMARGHEFHYSEIVDETSGLKALYRLTGREGEISKTEGYSRWNVLASYVHLHFGSNPEVAHQFVERCQERRERQ